MSFVLLDAKKDEQPLSVSLHKGTDQFCLKKPGNLYSFIFFLEIFFWNRKSNHSTVI
jgi:hypothetical protein